MWKRSTLPTKLGVAQISDIRRMLCLQLKPIGVEMCRANNYATMCCNISHNRLCNQRVLRLGQLVSPAPLLPALWNTSAASSPGPSRRAQQRSPISPRKPPQGATRQSPHRQRQNVAAANMLPDMGTRCLIHARVRKELRRWPLRKTDVTSAVRLHTAGEAQANSKPVRGRTGQLQGGRRGAKRIRTASPPSL